MQSFVSLASVLLLAATFYALLHAEGFGKGAAAALATVMLGVPLLIVFLTLILPVSPSFAEPLVAISLLSVPVALLALAQSVSRKVLRHE